MGGFGSVPLRSSGRRGQLAPQQGLGPFKGAALEKAWQQRTHRFMDPGATRKEENVRASVANNKAPADGGDPVKGLKTGAGGSDDEVEQEASNEEEDAAKGGSGGSDDKVEQKALADGGDPVKGLKTGAGGSDDKVEQEAITKQLKTAKGIAGGPGDDDTQKASEEQEKAAKGGAGGPGDDDTQKVDGAKSPPVSGGGTGGSPPADGSGKSEENGKESDEKDSPVTLSLKLGLYEHLAKMGGAALFYALYKLADPDTWSPPPPQVQKVPYLVDVLQKAFHVQLAEAQPQAETVYTILFGAFSLECAYVTGYLVALYIQKGEEDKKKSKY